MLLFRQLLAPTLARTLPDAVVLLFAVSQLSAIVDLPRLATALQARSWPEKTGLFAGFALLALPGIWRTIPRFRDDPAVRWVWSLPLPTRPPFAALAAVRALPTTLVALLLGPIAFLLALALCALFGAVLGDRRLRRTHTSGERGRWWGPTPLLARVNRDVLALRRHGGLQLLWPLLLPTLLHLAIARQWDPEGTALGGLFGLALVGWLPTHTATRLSNALGKAWLPRHDPLTPAQATLALALVTGAPLAVLVLLQTAIEPAGLLRRGTLALFYTLFGTWSVVTRTRIRRRHALGNGFAVAIFAGLAAWAWPPTWVVLATTSIVLTLHTLRRIR